MASGLTPGHYMVKVPRKVWLSHIRHVGKYLLWSNIYYKFTITNSLSEKNILYAAGMDKLFPLENTYLDIVLSANPHSKFKFMRSSFPFCFKMLYCTLSTYQLGHQPSCTSQHSCDLLFFNNAIQTKYVWWYICFLSRSLYFSVPHFNENTSILVRILIYESCI